MLGFSPIASAPIAARADFGRTATLAVTEDSDTILATGILPIFGTASLTEDNDTASSAGGNFVIGFANITEDDDTLESFILRYRFATITTSRPITADLITTTYN